MGCRAPRLMLNPSSTEIAVKKIALLLLVGATLLSANVAEEEAAVPQLHIDNETPEDYVAVDLAGVSYKKIGRDFYVISGTRDASIFYRRCNFPTATSSPASTFPTREGEVLQS